MEITLSHFNDSVIVKVFYTTTKATWPVCRQAGADRCLLWLQFSCFSKATYEICEMLL